MGHCLVNCRKKLKYKTIEDAKRALDRLQQAERFAHKPLNIYACPFCCGYHIGSRRIEHDKHKPC